MKKFTVVIGLFLLASVLCIIYISTKDQVYLEEFHDVKDVQKKTPPPFPVTDEKWPEDLKFDNGMDQKVFSSPEAVKGGTWNTYIPAFPPNFRQVGPDSNSSFRGYLDMNDMNLVEIHPETEAYIPSLAKSWAVGKDKKTVYYILDEDAKWDDGEAVTADDFVYTVKFMRTPGIIAPWYNQYYSTMIAEVLKFDDHKIAVRMTQPIADIVLQSAIRPLPYHYYGELRTVNKSYGINLAISYLKRDKKEVPEKFLIMQKKFNEDIKAYGEKTAAIKKQLSANLKKDEDLDSKFKEKLEADGVKPPEEPQVEIEVEDVELNWVNKHNWKAQPRTGAYNIYSYIKGKEVVFKRNEDWWAKDKKFFKYRYNADYLKYAIIRDEHIAFEYFLKGKLDQYGLVLPNYWHSKAKYLEPVDKGYMKKIWFYTDSPQPTSQISFNMDHKELGKKDLRLGIIYALNIQEMLDTVLRGDYERAETFHEGYGKYTNKDIKARRFDLQKAIELFEKSGYDKVGSDGIRVNSKGERLSFKVLYASAHHTERILVLVNEARKAGLELKPDQFDRTAVFKAMMNKQHEIAWHGWAPMARPTYRSQYHRESAHKKKNNNFSNFDDEEVSKMIDDYRLAIDSEKRIELSHKIEQKLFDLTPAVPTYIVPYFRQALWNWVKFPDHIAVRSSEMIMDEYFLFWIDVKEKEKIMKAMKKGEIIYGTAKLIKDERNRAEKVE